MFWSKISTRKVKQQFLSLVPVSEMGAGTSIKTLLKCPHPEFKPWFYFPVQLLRRHTEAG